MLPKTPKRILRILENLSTSVLTLDHRLKVTSVNPAGEMLFELSARQMVGQDLNRILSRNQPFIEELARALDVGQPFTNRGLRLEFITGRAVTVDYTVTPVSGAKGKPDLLVELSQVDRLLRLAREEHMLGQHAANRALLKGLAHEIKNPLGGLRGAAQLLERELGDRDLKEFTRIIIHEADRLRNLVDRMMGSTSPLKREAVNVHRILEHVRRLIAAEYPIGISFVTDYDPSVPDIAADPDQLTQAILNVVRNSAQAIEGKGEIHLRTRVERQFTIGHTRHRLALRLDVEDNGPGISPRLMDQIFLPMVSEKANGTGLGLSIAQDIISNHGGLIACDSKPGRTVFSIFLPMENTNGQ